MTRTRPPLYVALLGAAAGALVAGVLVSLAVGDDEQTVAGGAGAPAATASDFDAGGDPTTAAEGTGGAGITTSPDGSPAAPAAGAGPAAGQTSGGQSPTAAATAAGRTASDKGVTENAIKLGVVLLDLTTANAVGLAPDHYEVETQRKVFQAFVDVVNKGGGINGRRIELSFAVADPFNPDSNLAACQKLTVDDGVFAVLATPGYTSEALLCVAKEHRTPVIAQTWPPTEHVAASEGRLVTDGMATTRMMFNWVSELDKLTLLKGKKIGIVGDEDTANGDRQAIEQGLQPALAQFGYKATYRAKLAAERQTGASQMPVLVREMRAAGVDTVMLATNFLYATQWVQTAEAQGWRPQYHVTDLQGLTSDAVVENMPASFDNAYGITQYHFVRGAKEGMPEPDVDRTCRETYNRAAGESWKWGDRHPFTIGCWQVDVFQRVTTAAGTNPNRANWVSALHRQGPFPMVGEYGGSFSGKSDFADNVATVKRSPQCHCFKTIDAPRRVRF